MYHCYYHEGLPDGSEVAQLVVGHAHVHLNNHDTTNNNNDNTEMLNSNSSNNDTPNNTRRHSSTAQHKFSGFRCNQLFYEFKLEIALTN